MSIQALDVPSKRSSPVRRAFVVVGMHRSGTSAMTRTLSLLGAALPKGLMPAVDENNETGFWEPQSIADLNDEILQTLDSEWDDVFAFRPKEYLSNFDRFYLGRAVDLLDQEYNGAEVIVLKDPRVSVLTSFWERALGGAGYSTTYIIMVRNPLEVAESLRERDGFPREKSLLLWESYMLAAERDTRELERVFVAYNALLDDWRQVARRIEETAASPFARDTTTAALEIDRFLKRRMRHYRASAQDLNSRIDISENVKTLYRLLVNACEGAEIDHSAFDTVRSELAKMDNLVGPLLADLRGKVQRLSRELGDIGRTNGEFTARIESLEHDLMGERSEHENRRLEAEQTRSELAQARISIEELRVQVSEGQKRAEAELDLKKQIESELASWKSLHEREQESRIQLTQSLEHAKRETRNAELRLNKCLGEISSLTSELQQSEMAAKESLSVLERKEAEALAAAAQARDELARKENELREAVAESHLMDARLNQRFREIAELTELLAERQGIEARLLQQLDWLRAAGTALLNGSTTWKGRLLGILPASFHRKRQRRRLMERGLFDEAAYLAANPDVAADGADPLRHYLEHGIGENRPRD